MENKKDLLNYNNIIQTLEEWKKHTSTKLDKAILDDAIALLDNLKYTSYQINTLKDVRKALLNGARDWNQYSYGGCALVYNYDIAKHYLSEDKQQDFKFKRGPEKGCWNGIKLLDFQATCLREASRACLKAITIEWQRLNLQ